MKTDLDLRVYKPITPGVRHKVRVVRDGIYKKKSINILSYCNKNSSGRNNQGKITSFHRGGGVKKKYRIIDFKRFFFHKKAKIIRLEYDPYRSSYIALIAYENGFISYILAPFNLEIGTYISAGSNISETIGNTLPLHKISYISNIHNIELVPGKGAQLVRSAGTAATIIQKNKRNYVLIGLPSGEKRYINEMCLATIGRVSNKMAKNEKYGKAGYLRLKNRRPIVRGVAMNPIDHPHGGGEGKTSGGRPSVTPWGKITKGVFTRKKNNRSNSLIYKTRFDLKRKK